MPLWITPIIWAGSLTLLAVVSRRLRRGLRRARREGRRDVLRWQGRAW